MRRGILISAVGAAGICAGLVFSTMVSPPQMARAQASAAAIAAPNFVQLVKDVGPAVVNISVKVQRASGRQMDPFGRSFGGGGPEVGEGVGTGFFISSDGYILTNDHVVGEASEITVTVADGRELKGKVIGTDQRTDIGLIKVEDKKPFPAVRLGDSDSAQIGEWVVAIGNPFGLDHTVTAGIISAKGRRNIRPSGRAGEFDFIQTDASINPGNSGGPLLNVRGEVIGINSAVNMAAQGIGFAIPANMVKTLLPQLKDKGKVTRSYLGVKMQDIDRNLAKSWKLDDTKGALITEVVDGSPAAKAGLKAGDVVVSFEGKPVGSSDDLRWVAGTAGVGKTVSLGLTGKGGSRTIKVTLGELTDELAMGRGRGMAKGGAKSAPALGVTVSSVTPDMARQLGLERAVGVVVTDVDKGSPAVNLTPGDVIVSVNDVDVSSDQQFVQATQRIQRGDMVRLLVVREGTPMWLAFNIP
jgi:serine protease Do